MRLLIGISIFVSILVLCRVIFEIIKRRRIAALKEAANMLGLEFHEDCSTEVFKRYRCLNHLRTRIRTTFLTYFNLIQGKFQERDVVFFDFFFRTYSGSRHTDSGSGRSHKISVMILHLDQQYPELIILKRKFWSWFWTSMGEAFNLNDLTIEYAEFSKYFSIKTANDDFAREFCSEEMVNFLWENEDIFLEVDDGYVAIFFEPFMKPSDLEWNLKRLLEIESRIPPFKS